MSFFGTSTAQTQNKPAGTFGSTFGNTSTGTGSSLFGNQPTQQPKPFSLNTSQQPTGSIFGAPAQQQQQQQTQSQPGLFTFGQQPLASQRPADQVLRFGTSTGTDQNAIQALWEEGRGLSVSRSIPAQMSVVKDKWDAATLASPLRTYLYQHVGDETEALRYRPGPGEDEDKWEQAVQKRPGAEWVPLLVRGFRELGTKAKLQGDALARCNIMLKEINDSLDRQAQVHQQTVAARLAECKRRQLATSRRTLALAVKVQILRNKGYVMDNAEEELKAKMEKLEREVFDPSLEAREQEIWARMLGIRERAKRLKMEMDKIAPIAAAEEPVLEEGTIRTAKQILDAYDTQLRHLQKELQLIQQEYDDWEKLSEAQNANLSTRR